MVAAIPVLCPRIQNRGCRLLRLDSIRGFGGWQLAWGNAVGLAAARRAFAQLFTQGGAGGKRSLHAVDFPGHAIAGAMGDRPVQPGVFRTAIVVDAGDDAADRSLPSPHGGLGGGTGWIRRCEGRIVLQFGGRSNSEGTRARYGLCRCLWTDELV